MSGDWELRVGGEAVDPPDGWQIEWVDPLVGQARLSNGQRSVLAVVEGAGSEWWVTIRGRRIRVDVLSWREKMLAEAGVGAMAVGGPVEVRATLPGLIIGVEVEQGSEVADGDPLLTLEAMKMENEVRAPRSGRVAQVAVSAGEVVAAGQLLLRIE